MIAEPRLISTRFEISMNWKVRKLLKISSSTMNSTITTAKPPRALDDPCPITRSMICWNNSGVARANNWARKLAMNTSTSPTL